MTTFYENSLSAGGVVSRNAEILIPEVVGIDGDVKVKVTVKPNADAGEPYWLLENNTAESGSFVLWRNVFISTPRGVACGGEFSICRIQSHKERVGVGAGDIQNHPSRRHPVHIPSECDDSCRRQRSLLLCECEARQRP